MRVWCILIAVTVTFSSCEKVFFETNQESVSPQENLDYLWNQCKEKYVYFQEKNVNWEEVRLKYQAQIYEEMTQDSLFRVLSAMLYELKDGHVNLVSTFETSFYPYDQFSPSNFNWSTVVDHYITPNYHISGPFSHNFITGENIGYVRLGTFREAISQQQLDHVLTKYSNTDGLILDLRENGGGRISRVYQILSRFIDETSTVYFTRIKSGPGPTHFTTAVPVIVEPYNGTRFSKKVMVLADRGTYSSGSLFSLATQSIDRLTLIGDTTGGGIGIPNGGQLPNSWTYRFSITQTLDLNLNSSLENGVPPQIPAQFDWNDLTRDEILDRAIQELR